MKELLNSPQNNPIREYPILRFFFGLAISVIGAMLIIYVTLNLSGDEFEELTLYMIGTGFLTITLSYTFYKLKIIQWFASLRWTMLAMTIMTVGLVFINVWVIARIMFVDAHYLTLTTALLVFAGITAVVFGFFISKSITDRISELSDAAQQVAGGDLSTRLQVDGNDELASLAQTFNHMASSLEQLDKQKQALEQARRNLVAWVSHDLRTPLASMRVMIEAMEDGVVTDEETTQRYLASCGAEIEHLTHLISDLFDLAQMDVGYFDLQFETASLRDLISDTIGTMTPKARKRAIELKGEVAPDVDLAYMATDKVQRVLYNLIGNAIQYTPTGEAITLRAWKKQSFVQIDVHNTGVTIPDDVLPNLFESFYRGEQARSKSGDGVRGAGLGLAIARAFVEAHGGEIWAESSSEADTTFSFTLPIQRKLDRRASPFGEGNQPDTISS